MVSDITMATIKEKSIEERQKETCCECYKEVDGVDCFFNQGRAVCEKCMKTNHGFKVR